MTSTTAPRPPRKYETKTQMRLREGLEAWNRSCPNYAEQVFWRQVERDEGVTFFGGDDDFDQRRRDDHAQMILNMGRRWVTVLPMSARAAWRADYLKRKERSE